MAKETSSVCGCRWRTLLTQSLYQNFKTQVFEILLFCPVNTDCFVEYNASYVLHFVTAIILRHTKNIYEICKCKPHRSPESKFPNEYSNVIFFQIDQHLKKLLQKYKKVPILWITVYGCRYSKACLEDDNDPKFVSSGKLVLVVDL